MKAANKILIYDDTCPMCKAYTKLFVQNGLLETNGRQTFLEVDVAVLKKIDKDKYRNEIPFINTSDNTITYGIDAMLEILGARFPFIKIVGHTKSVNWLLKKLYNLISYNRRVITASNRCNSNFDCIPDFNIKYRILFLFLGFCFNTIMLAPEYNHVFMNSSFSKATMAEMQLAHLMLVGVNVILPVRLSLKQAIEFLGQVNITAMIYSLLLIPLICFNKFISIPFFINNIYLAVVFIIMIITYRRRMKYAGIFKHRYIMTIEAITSALFLCYLAF